MKILVLGSDGYIGYPLTIQLLKNGHEVFGVDDYSRRARVYRVSSDSLTPIITPLSRSLYLTRKYSNYVGQDGFTLDIHFLKNTLRNFKPDAIVHLAEMPSAPWSMIDAEHAMTTQRENVEGTLALLWAIREECPDAHLVKLGTMGEYGTPNCDIPEGEIPESCIGGVTYPTHVIQTCPMAGLPFPRTAGSFYHLSKVHDTHNIIFACKTWGLHSTDIMQGVVFGLTDKGPEEELTRFDYDEYFGTAINRFCAQALIGHPLTVYGKGTQTRGFISLKDSIKCICLALENPPKEGEYRTFNQFESLFTIMELAERVYKGARSSGLSPEIKCIPNPRTESEEHYYNPTHDKLFKLGYSPALNIWDEITNLISRLLPYKDRVKKEVIMPTTKWR